MGARGLPRAAAGSGGVGVELQPYNTASAAGSGLDFSVSQ
jgi:hypothetical protein